MTYDCIIIGGGIAGLQAAIQLGRYQRDVLVINSNHGRSNLCRCYHNILGWPDGVSGQKLRDIGKGQAEKLGVEFLESTVNSAEQQEDSFVISAAAQEYTGDSILLATGVMDRIPPFQNLTPCLGISVYICPDCDGYEIKDKRALVLGSGNAGANMALALTYWSKDLIYINHEQHEVDKDIMERIKEKRISYYNEPIYHVLTQDAHIKGVVLEDGTVINAEHAFVAFGGNKVKSDLAKNLGVELHKNKHILVDPRTKMTNIEKVWAAGDVTAHSEQVTIAMGDGLQAAIWIHKTLLKG